MSSTVPARRRAQRAARRYVACGDDPRRQRTADRLARPRGLPRRRRRDAAGVLRGGAPQPRQARRAQRSAARRRATASSRPARSSATSTSSRSAGTCRGPPRCTASSGRSRTRRPGSSELPRLACSLHDMPEVRFVGHHLAHATIAFHASDFDERRRARRRRQRRRREHLDLPRRPRARPLVRKRVWPRSHSLGYLYDAACRFVGFGPLQAGKLMGLSAYGRARGRRAVGAAARRRAARARGVDDGDGFNRYIHAWTAQLDRLAGGRRVGARRATSCSSTRSPCRSRSARRRPSSARCCGLAALARELTGTREPLPRRRRRAELQGQRPAERAGLRAARAARRRHRARRGVARRAAAPRARADGRISAFLGPAPGAPRRPTARSTGCTASRCRSSASATALQAGRIGAIVAGAGRDRPARARPPLDRRRPRATPRCTAA